MNVMIAHCIFSTVVHFRGSASGSEERGALAVPLPSAATEVMAAANTSTAGAKLGNIQSLRVRLDSYPAG